MKNVRWVFIVSGIMSALLLLSACGPKAITLRVEMNEFEFKPSTLSVPAGTPITLILKNSGMLEHHFAIMQKGFQASVPYDEGDEEEVYWQAKLPAQQTANLQFTAPSEPGEYEIVCGTAGHLEQGMKGTLVVSD